MEYPQFIVYLKNKDTEQFEYKSGIKDLDREGNIYHVEFQNGKTYRYGIDKVRYYQLIECKEGVNVYENGRLKREKTTLLDYGNSYLLASDNSPFEHIRKGDNIEICTPKENVDNSRITINYFKQIVSSVATSFVSDVNGDKTANVDQMSANMVIKALDNIDIEDDRTAFSNYIDGITPKSNRYTKSVIFPYGCNESQKLAVERALSSSMSIIEGPPGTGKTQTILNIIANIVCDNKSVAVVSNNNSAVQNILKKLKREEYAPIAALLGSSDNRKAFFEETKIAKPSRQSHITESELTEIDTKISILSSELTECFKKRNRVAILKSQLTDIENQQRHLTIDQPIDNELYNEIDKRLHNKKALQNPLALRAVMLKGRDSFFTKLILIFKYGYYDFRHLNRYIDHIYIYANHKFYNEKIKAIKSEIEETEAWLKSVDEEPKLKQLIALSNQMFDEKLAVMANDIDDKCEFNSGNYIRQFSKFIKSYPIITSTTLSLKSSIPTGYLFDYLIIDESSQVDIIKASICFACARRVVVVGDSCQLSHIVDRSSTKTANELLQKLNITPAYDYVTMSILDSLKELYGDAIPTTLLKEHYRCHPDIIGFCNKRYYNDQLVVLTQTKEHYSPQFKIIETNISGAKDGYNQRQIDETKSYIDRNFADNYKCVGVVSPYRTHADMLQSQLPEGCEADTIHKYQGREKDFIIFNSVKGEINTFIDNPNLINVAVSRAVKSFVIVKPQAMKIPHGTNIGDLIRYICYRFDRETVIENGNVNSVFDLLYKEYNRIYVDFAAKNKNIKGSPAEIIMHKLLEEILKESQFGSIDFKREVYLRDIVHDTSSFSSDETTFIKRDSRLDFLLYNKIDFTPILAIEVDGVSFHRNEKQQSRDALKDSILGQLKLPILRLATDGHNERESIIESLQKAMEID